MLRYLEFIGKDFGSGKNKYLYLSGSRYYRSYFCNCVKRKGYLDVGIRHGIDVGGVVDLRENTRLPDGQTIIFCDYNRKSCFTFD